MFFYLWKREKSHYKHKVFVWWICVLSCLSNRVLITDSFSIESNNTIMMYTFTDWLDVENGMNSTKMQVYSYRKKQIFFIAKLTRFSFLSIFLSKSINTENRYWGLISRAIEYQTFSLDLIQSPLKSRKIFMVFWMWTSPWCVITEGFFFTLFVLHMWIIYKNNLLKWIPNLCHYQFL